MIISLDPRTQFNSRRYMFSLTPRSLQVIGTASLVEDLGADSLDTTELVMALDEEFQKTETPDEYVEKIITGKSLPSRKF